jgi:hypothetical protein
MYYLPQILPAVRRMHFPLSRDQLMLLMLAVNELLLGLETYLAHQISGTIVPREWIPIIFGPAAGIILLLAGLLARRRRPQATLLANLVFIASIAVGLLGAYFHVMRALLPAAAPGEKFSVLLLVWAPPILGPLTFSLVGLLGISASWIESPPDSGRLVITSRLHLSLPYSKTRAYFFIIGLGCLATVVSSVLDHARTNFTNPWLWLPTAVGIFTTLVAVILGALDRPSRVDLITYSIAMLLMILVGVTGSLLHIRQDLTEQGAIVGERFIRGAPLLAPLLFADLGTLGLIVLLDPSEKDTNHGSARG